MEAMAALHANPDVVFQRVDDEVVLVHLKTNQIFALNATGARFWELFAAGGDRSEIEATMLAEFDVEPDVLRAEIDALLVALAREDIVRTTTSTG
jgi:hypothetical protein